MSYTKLFELQSDTIDKLRKSGLDMSPDAWCRIDRNRVEIGVLIPELFNPPMGDTPPSAPLQFASEVSVYYREVLFATHKYVDGEFQKDDNPEKFEINFGTSGCFTPEDTASYWRSIHAAEILRNWESVCEIVLHAVNQYREMVDQHKK